MQSWVGTAIFHLQNHGFSEVEASFVKLAWILIEGRPQDRHDFVMDVVVSDVVSLLHQMKFEVSNLVDSFVNTILGIFKGLEDPFVERIGNILL
jgi:hypothetical protein